VARSMAYDNTGKGHHTSIEDEQRFSDWLNSGGHREFDWGEHRFIEARTMGGTQNTEDVVAETTGGLVRFSCKLARGGVASHSHTYKNTSRLITRLKKEGHYCVQPIIQLESFRDQEVRRIPDANQRRENRTMYAAKMRAACAETLLNLPKDVITDLFELSMKHALEMDWMVLYDQPIGRYYCWRPNHHPAIAALEGGWDVRITPKQRGSESANLVLIGPNGEEADLKLRLRVKHNNGVSDLFHMGTQNTGSFVTTIQQDPGSVQAILDLMDDHGHLLCFEA
jgi:hypothetical protein